MSEAERIINYRFISRVSADLLTFSILLLMESNWSITKGLFKREDTYARRWWRQIQYLSYDLSEDAVTNTYQGYSYAITCRDQSPTFATWYWRQT